MSLQGQGGFHPGITRKFGCCIASDGMYSCALTVPVCVLYVYSIHVYRYNMRSLVPYSAAPKIGDSVRRKMSIFEHVYFTQVEVYACVPVDARLPIEPTVLLA